MQLISKRIQRNIARTNERLEGVSETVVGHTAQIKENTASIASLQPTVAGRTSMGMAMGFNGGESTIPIGIVHNFMQDKASVKVGTSYNSQDKASGGVGFGWTFN